MRAKVAASLAPDLGAAGLDGFLEVDFRFGMDALFEALLLAGCLRARKPGRRQSPEIGPF
jgi:hypothetical protein